MVHGGDGDGDGDDDDDDDDDDFTTTTRQKNTYLGSPAKLICTGLML